MLDSSGNAIFYVTVSMSEKGLLSFTDPKGNLLLSGLKVADAIGDDVLLTVKLYYYANSSRADLIVRYSDMSADKSDYPQGKSMAVAAEVTGVTADLIAGTSSKYSAASISVNKNNGVMVYLDDVYVRNYTE